MKTKLYNLKNARAKYKRFYGIDFGDEYDIHHIDLDKSNNDIENLLLLPKELHKEYHRALKQLAEWGIDYTETNNIIIPLFLVKNNDTLYFAYQAIQNYIKCYRKCSVWIARKNSMERGGKKCWDGIIDTDCQHYKNCK